MPKHKGTTIAFRDGILASDSQASLGATIVSQACEKIVKGRGALIGGVGELAAISKFKRWALKIDWTKVVEPPEYEMPEGAAGIVIIKGRTSPYIIINYEESGWFEDPDSPFYAWGSGSDVALGALHHGARAHEAVEIAAKISHGSGGPVKTIQFTDDDNPKPKRTRTRKAKQETCKETQDLNGSQ